MDNVAFKRSYNTEYAGYFHPRYIVEFYRDPRDFANSAEGWETLAEDDFAKEMLKNKGLHDGFIRDQVKMINSLGNSARVAELFRLQLTKEERLELKQLRKFKRTHPKRRIGHGA